MGLNIAIVDDDERLAKSLRASLLVFDGIGEVSIFSSGNQFIERITNPVEGSILPEVVIMDISMNEQDEGIKTTQRTTLNYPEAKIVMFTISDDDSNIFEAFKAGASGYLLKSESPEFIFKTILEIQKGGSQMSPPIARKVIGFFTQHANNKTRLDLDEANILTFRESEILRSISKGYSYQKTADELFISAHTVKKHLSNIYKKLRVTNKVQAIRKSANFK